MCFRRSNAGTSFWTPDIRWRSALHAHTFELLLTPFGPPRHLKTFCKTRRHSANPQTDVLQNPQMYCKTCKYSGKPIRFVVAWLKMLVQLRTAWATRILSPVWIAICKNNWISIGYNPRIFTMRLMISRIKFVALFLSSV